ncbi:hypothetical protein TNCV_2620021 [Trichonephila clavipes]|nr:hypothetical protein TNCV_2620021 [Trichonephila clavipes]
MMPSRSFRKPNRQLNDFEGGRIVGIREGGWSYQTIGRHLQRTDTAVQSGVPQIIAKTLWVVGTSHGFQDLGCNRFWIVFIWHKMVLFARALEKRHRAFSFHWSESVSHHHPQKLSNLLRLHRAGRYAPVYGLPGRKCTSNTRNNLPRKVPQRGMQRNAECLHKFGRHFLLTSYRLSHLLKELLPTYLINELLHELSVVLNEEAPAKYRCEHEPVRQSMVRRMIAKYQMIKFIDICEVWFLPESVARVVAIVGDHRCHTPRH